MTRLLAIDGAATFLVTCGLLGLALRWVLS